MLLEKSLWLSLLLILIQGIVIYFAGYFGGYKVAKWRLGQEISIKHFDQIKEGVIHPILRVLNRDIRDILNKANVIIVLEAQDLYGEEKDREKIKIGNKYSLSINNNLRSFLELNGFFGEQVDKSLFNDLENHFNNIKNCFETFRSLLNNYTKSYLSFTKDLQNKIELQCKEIGFIQDELSCQILRGSNLRYVNTPEIALWVFKKLF